MTYSCGVGLFAKYPVVSDGSKGVVYSSIFSSKLAYLFLEVKTYRISTSRVTFCCWPSAKFLIMCKKLNSMENCNASMHIHTHTLTRCGRVKRPPNAPIQMRGALERWQG